MSAPAQFIPGVKKFIHKHALIYWVLLGMLGILCLMQAVHYAHHQLSQMDEGAFMVKGYNFVIGTYAPFQEYGFWTNKMPLSFYLPGLAQALFGPGLLTGRYFAILLLVLMLIPLWGLLNRLRGKWWALLGVLVVVINPTLIETYVKANSQVVVGFLLAWALFFLLGEERKPWQVGIAGILCALAVLARQNMVFFLPFVVLYAFCMYGRRAGFAALAGAGIPMLIAHLMYYPEIMWIWFEYMPVGITRLLGWSMTDGGGSAVWNPEVSLLDRSISFFMATRFHFFSLLGIGLALFLLYRQSFWKNNFERGMVAWMSMLFISLFAIHAWASLGKNYCVFCFAGYISFFMPLGLVIAVITVCNLLEKRANLSILGCAAAILLIVPGLFFGSPESVGRWVVDLPAPRLRGGRILAGSTELGTIFGNRFGLDSEQLLLLVPPLFGLVVSILLIAAVWIFYRFFRRKDAPGFGHILMVCFLLLTVLWTPTPLLGRGVDQNTCGADILTAYENAGSHLARIVTPGASVYWGAGSVVTPLAYLTHAEINPPQLNGVYSFRRGGDRELLEKLGLYNEESLEIWRAQDNFFLIGEKYFNNFWHDFLDPQFFLEHPRTIAVNPCQPDSAIRIFERLPSNNVNKN